MSVEYQYKPKNNLTIKKTTVRKNSRQNNSNSKL
jgi:hypothetical protein